MLDVGCGAGTFLAHAAAETGARPTGVDFKDLSEMPWMKQIDFRHGLLHEQHFDAKQFDLITMWHFLEHDYKPLESLNCARDLLRPEGRLVIEVPLTG